MVQRSQRFELDRLIDKSDEAILAEIRRVASLVPDPVLTGEAFSRLSRVDRSTVYRRFGSWRNALNAAGVGERLHPLNVERLSDSDVLSAIKGLAEKLGKSQLTVGEVEQHLSIGYSRLLRSWGSSQAAFAAAGISTTATGRRHTSDDCFENLLAVWTHYGRPPTFREMRELPSIISGRAYERRYGSWNRALSAFVDRANNSDETIETETEAIASDNNAPTEAIPANPVKRGPRDISLGLRFKVLRRDSFRCVLCGDNPPRNAECVLHVDHIQPWSLGGATVFENLRTLCAPCNLGRSNRYFD